MFSFTFLLRKRQKKTWKIKKKKDFALFHHFPKIKNPKKGKSKNSKFTVYPIGLWLKQKSYASFITVSFRNFHFLVLVVDSGSEVCDFFILCDWITDLSFDSKIWTQNLQSAKFEEKWVSTEHRLDLSELICIREVDSSSLLLGDWICRRNLSSVLAWVFELFNFNCTGKFD